MTGVWIDPRSRIRPVFGECSRRRLLGVAGVFLVGALSGGLAAPAPVTRLADRIDEVTFASAALGREMRFVVIHPTGEGVDKANRPVLFLLHGRGRHRHSLLEWADTRESLLGAGMWIVLPDGEDGWYVNSPVVSSDRFGDYLEEVVRLASAQFDLRSDPSVRAIAGWSMGGYGAVRFAENHPGEVGTVATIVGLLDFPREETLPAGRNYAVPVGRFGADPARWTAHNPLYLIARLRGKSILVITAEDAFDRVMNENFSHELARAGIVHDYRMLPGAHTLEVVRAALPSVLSFVKQSTLAPPRP